jgi:SOS-response transcriptional repressor LexA
MRTTRLPQLTDRQHIMLMFVADTIECTGIPPTINDLAQHFSLAPSNVRVRLMQLERKGYLCRKPFTHRGLWLTEQTRCWRATRQLGARLA